MALSLSTVLELEALVRVLLEIMHSYEPFLQNARLDGYRSYPDLVWDCLISFSRIIITTGISPAGRFLIDQLRGRLLDIIPPAPLFPDADNRYQSMVDTIDVEVADAHIARAYAEAADNHVQVFSELQSWLDSTMSRYC